MSQTTFTHYLVLVSFSDPCIPGRVEYTIPLIIKCLSGFPEGVTVRALLEKQLRSKLRMVDFPVFRLKKVSARVLMTFADFDSGKILHLTVGDPPAKNEKACVHCGLE